jgi:hypothetical protein
VPSRRPVGTGLGTERVERRGPARSIDVRGHQPGGSAEQAFDRPIVEPADRCERVDALDEAHLAAIDIAEPGLRGLVEQRLADRHRPAARCSKPPHRFPEIRLAGEEVRAESGQRRVERDGTRVEQLYGRGVEAHRDRAGHLDHRHRPRRAAAPRLCAPVAVP